MNYGRFKEAAAFFLVSHDGVKWSVVDGTLFNPDLADVRVLGFLLQSGWFIYDIPDFTPIYHCTPYFF